MLDNFKDRLKKRRLLLNILEEKLSKMNLQEKYQFIIELLSDYAPLYRPSAYTQCKNDDCVNITPYGGFCDPCRDLWAEAVFNDFRKNE